MAERENLPVPVDPDFNLEIGGLQPDDPVHFGQMNTILARLLTNEAFLEKLAGKMVEKALIAHVLDSANPSMVLGADQAPELTKLIDVERKRIGELYSDLGKYYKLSGGIRIPNGTDLFTYKTVGNFYCDFSADTYTLLNCPTREAFTLKAELSTGSNYPSLSIREFNTGRIYYTYYDPVQSRWIPWKHSIQSTDLLFGSIAAFSIPANSSARKAIDLPGYGDNYRLFGGIRGSEWAIIAATYCNNNQAVLDIRNLNTSSVINVSIDYTVIRK